jgi:hypothetical protein
MGTQDVGPLQLKGRLHLSPISERKSERVISNHCLADECGYRVRSAHFLRSAKARFLFCNGLDPETPRISLVGAIRGRDPRNT